MQDKGWQQVPTKWNGDSNHTSMINTQIYQTWFRYTLYIKKSFSKQTIVRYQDPWINFFFSCILFGNTCRQATLSRPNPLKAELSQSSCTYCNSNQVKYSCFYNKPLPPGCQSSISILGTILRLAIVSAKLHCYWHMSKNNEIFIVATVHVKYHFQDSLRLFQSKKRQILFYFVCQK